MGLINKEISNNIVETTTPFQIFSYINSNDASSYYIEIQPGTVNNILPSNIIENNGLKRFSISKNQIQYIILKCLTNGKYLNSAKIEIKNAPPAAQVPVAFGLPSNVEILIGGVYNTTTFQVVNTNFTLSAKIAYILNNDKIASLPFVPYFIWG
jgi:hypothetical protein